MLSRRRFLTSSLAALAVAGPAHAQDDRVTRSVLRQLERQGFEIVEVQRTLLGRVRIVAQRGALWRELVLDPRNGLVLRDIATDGVDGPEIPGIADYDEDLEDDEDEDEDDDEDDDDDDEEE